MTRQDLLMTIAVEECCEIGQRITKAMRFGLTEVQQDQPLTNEARIVYELTDLLTTLDAIGIIQIDPDGCLVVDAVMQDEKSRKLEKYQQLSRDRGRLDP